MRARKLVIGSGLLFAVAALATSAPALAQQPASTSKIEPFPAACTSVPASESERAHKLYEAGKSYYDDATYDAAITQFREAYKKDCSKHELLIIISRAYELKGDKPAAIAALETYLERVPNSPDAAQHHNRIENLKKQLAAKPPPPAPTVTAPPATTAPPPPPPAEVREHTIPPWILVGVGGAAVIVGAVVVATAPSLPAGCDADSGRCAPIAGESPDDFDKRKNDAGASRDQPKYGIVTMVGGGVLVAGGLLWHFLEPTGAVEKAGKAKPSVSPELGPGFAGLSLGGSF
jgi:tetratricopeptide (TPR) repeat protein